MKIRWQKLISILAALMAAPLCILLLSRFDPLDVGVLGGATSVISAILCAAMIATECRLRGWKFGAVFVVLAAVFVSFSVGLAVVSFFYGWDAAGNN